MGAGGVLSITAKAREYRLSMPYKQDNFHPQKTTYDSLDKSRPTVRF